MNTSSHPAREKLFTALRPNLRGLASRGTIRSYPKNSVIINEGEAGDALFILLQGRVKVYSNDSAGREITFNFVDHGDYFAEMCIDGGRPPPSGMTVEPALCSVVTPAAVRQHMSDDPEFAFDLISQVIRRARNATDTARNMALLDVYGRVVVALQGAPGHARTERPLTLTKITHQSI